MNNPYKKRSLVLCILTSIFLFISLVITFTFEFVGLSGGDYTKYLTYCNKAIGAGFDLFSGTRYGFTGSYCFITYLTYALSLLLLIAIIAGIVHVVKNKRKRLIWFVIPMLVFYSLACNVLIISCKEIDGTMFYAFKYENIFNFSFISTYPFWGWMMLVSLILLLLAFILGFFTYVYGLEYATRFANPVIEEEEENPEAVYTVPTNIVVENAAAPDDVCIDDEDDEEDDEDEDMELDEIDEIPPEPKVEQPAPLTKDDIASLLKDVVRDMVRDELARSAANEKPEKKETPTPTNSSVTGATFGGPLVVQYFNGGINSPSSEPKVVEAPKDNKEPVEEKKEEVKVEEIVPAKAKEEVKVAPAPVPVTPVEKKPIIRIPFTTRIVEADKEMQDNYNELKNEFLSYGLHSRVSNSGDTFRLHTKTYCKLTIAGKSLKLYFALNPKDYQGTTIPVQDASNKGIYKEIPLIFKVKSSLSMKRAKQLIQDATEKDGLEQKEIGTVNWVKEIKAELKKSK